MTKEELFTEAQFVRSGAETFIRERRIPYITWDYFPRGRCGLRALGLWLINMHPDQDFYYVCGESEGRVSHAWLEHQGVIIDITADQFNKSLGPVVVLPQEKSIFHRNFHIAYKRKLVINVVGHDEETQIYDYLCSLQKERDSEVHI